MPDNNANNGFSKLVGDVYKQSGIGYTPTSEDITSIQNKYKGDYKGFLSDFYKQANIDYELKDDDFSNIANQYGFNKEIKQKPDAYSSATNQNRIRDEKEAQQFTKADAFAASSPIAKEIAGFGRGMHVGGKQFAASAAKGLLETPEMSEKIGDVLTLGLSKKIRQLGEHVWGKGAYDFENKAKDFLKDKSADVSTWGKSDLPEMQGGAGEFLGQLIPQTAMFATAILLKNPAVATAATGAVGLSATGAGLEAYDEYIAETGEEVNDNKRLFTGIGYGLAEFAMERLALGKLMPKSVRSKVMSKLLGGKNVESAAKAGKELLENFIQKQPGKAKQLINSFGKATTVEAAQESATEIAQMATDAWIVGDENAWKGAGQRIGLAALGGAAMGGMLAPFSNFSQRTVDKARRQQQGYVTIAQDNEGNTWELIEGDNGSIYGISPSGKKSEELPDDIVQNSVTVKTDEFNRMLEENRKAGNVSEELYRESQHNVIRDKVSNQFTMFGNTKDGNMHIWYDKENPNEDGKPSEWYVIDEDDTGMVVLTDGEGNRRVESKKKVQQGEEVYTYEDVVNFHTQRYDEQNPIDDKIKSELPESVNINGKTWRVEPNRTPEGAITVKELDDDGNSTGPVEQLTEEEFQALLEEQPKDPTSSPDFRIVQVGKASYKLVPNEDSISYNVEGATTEQEANKAAKDINNTLGEKVEAIVIKQEDPDPFTPDTYSVKVTPRTKVAPAEPSYQFAEESISREEAEALIMEAETQDELSGLNVENDEELQVLMEEKFAPAEPVYKVGKKKLTRAQALAKIKLGKTEGLTIENDEELTSMLPKTETIEEESEEKLTETESEVVEVEDYTEIKNEESSQKEKQTDVNSLSGNIGNTVRVGKIIGVLKQDNDGVFIVEKNGKDYIVSNIDAAMDESGVTLVREKVKPIVNPDGSMSIRGKNYSVQTNDNGSIVSLTDEDGNIVKNERWLISAEIERSKQDNPDIKTAENETGIKNEDAIAVDGILNENMTESISDLLENGITDETSEVEFLSAKIWAEDAIARLENNGSEYAANAAESIYELLNVLENEYNKRDGSSAGNKTDGTIKTKKKEPKEARTEKQEVDVKTETEQKDTPVTIQDKELSEKETEQEKVDKFKDNNGGISLDVENATPRQNTKKEVSSLSKAEAEVDPNPSDAQIEAGNAKKGHVRFAGFNITIENASGSTRKSKPGAKKKWSQKMANPYGYFKRTKGKDGDQVDVFIGPNEKSDKVFVVDQINEDGSFDEHKVMVGFNSEQEAKEAYMANYESGWKGFGAITEMNKPAFKKWLNVEGKNKRPKRKPVSELGASKKKEGDAGKKVAFMYVDGSFNRGTIIGKTNDGRIKVKDEFGKIYNIREKDFIANDDIRLKRYDNRVDILNTIAPLQGKVVSGFPVEVVETAQDLPDHIKKMKDFGDGKGISALYDGKTKTIYIVAENNNVESAKSTWLHEQGIHGGLRVLIKDKAQLDALMEKVVDSVGMEEIKKVVPKFYWDKPKAEVGEEYLAYLSERKQKEIPLTKSEQSAWNKLVNSVRNILKSLYGKNKLTKQEIEDIIHASVQAIYQERENLDKVARESRLKVNGAGPGNTTRLANPLEIYNPTADEQVRYRVTNTAFELAEKSGLLTDKDRQVWGHLNKLAEIDAEVSKLIGEQYSTLDEIKMAMEDKKRKAKFFDGAEMAYNYVGRKTPKPVKDRKINAASIGSITSVVEKAVETAPDALKKKIKENTKQFIGGHGRANVTEINKVIQANPDVREKLIKIQEELGGVSFVDKDGNIQTSPLEEQKSLIEVNGKELPNPYRPNFGGFKRSIPQAYLESLPEDRVESFRSAITSIVEEAYVSGDTESLGFEFLDTRPDKIGESKTRFRTPSPLKVSEKTIAALNLSSECPMFMIGSHGCYFNGCYVTGIGSGGNTTNYYSRAVYSGEILEMTQESVDLLNKVGGLRLNGQGDLTTNNFMFNQLKDILKHAKMRNLKLKIITKQDGTMEMLQALNDGKDLQGNKIDPVDISGVQVQMSFDPYWIPVTEDDLPGSYVREMGMAQEGNPQEMVVQMYKDMGRDAKIVEDENGNETVWRKYGYSIDQAEEVFKKYPDVAPLVLKRVVVGTHKEIIHYAKNHPEMLQTWMHASIRPGMMSDIDGRLMEGQVGNYTARIGIYKDKDGWHIKAQGSKDAVKPIDPLSIVQQIARAKSQKEKQRLRNKLDEAEQNQTDITLKEKKTYTALENAIKKDPEADKIFRVLKGQLGKDASALCCTSGASKDACFNCTSGCHENSASWKPIIGKELNAAIRSKGISIPDVGELSIVPREESDVRFKTTGEVEDSKEFKKWSKDAPILQGNEILDTEPQKPQVFKVHHGTTNEFYVFDPKVKGEIGSHFGLVNYFTSDEYDASQNYAGEGPDLTNRIESKKDRIQQELEVETDESYDGMYDFISENYPDFDVTSLDEDLSPEEIADRIARNELIGGEEKVMDLYVRLDNPVVINGNNETWIEPFDEDVVAEHREQAKDEVLEENDAKEDQVDEFEDEILERYEELMQYEENEIITAAQRAAWKNGVDDQVVIGALPEEASYGFETVSASAIDKSMRENEELGYAENDEGQLISSQVIADFFNELGFDGIVLAYARDNFQNMDMSPNASHVHLFPENKNQVKLADGTNIDFSETSDDIRFKVIGEWGALNIDRAYEATERIDNLATAKEMETAKKSPSEIKFATGWERGVDKKWRYEISDDQFTPEFTKELEASSEQYIDERTQKTYSRIPNILGENTDLMKAYPQLEDIMVTIDIHPEHPRAAGSYQAFMDRAGEGLFDIEPEIIVKARNQAEANSILAHEVQHAIQMEEGFAMGGTVSLAKEYLLEQKGKALWRVNDQIIKLGEKRATLKTDEERDTNISLTKTLIGIRNSLDEEVKRIEEDRTPSYKAYQRIAGEVEARNVQNRMPMDPEHRRRFTLEETEDVERINQIILSQGLGQARMDDTRFKAAPPIETKEFKEWFGGSKVVDDKGKPLVVYHGTDADFNVFDTIHGEYYFAKNPEYAANHILPARKPSILPVFVKATNPYYADFKINHETVSRFRNQFNNLEYDGIIGKDGGTNETVYVVFSPTQIKSATGNIGTFDPNNPDIRFKVNEAKQSVKQVTTLPQKIREMLQDNMLSLKKWQNQLIAEGIDIRDFENPYQKETLYHGKVLNKMDNFTDKEGKKLTDASSEFAKKTGLSPEEVGNYTIAKHGPERNRHIAEQNESQVGEDYSGLTELREKVMPKIMKENPGLAQIMESQNLNEFADSYARMVEAKAGKAATDRFWKAVREATDYTLKEWRNAGFLSREQYKQYKSRYGFYVPLRGWEQTDEFDYSSQVGEYSSPIKRAKGRKTLSDNPLAYIMSMANSAVVTGERNRIKQAAANLVRNNRKKLEDRVVFKPVYYVKTDRFNDKGEPIYEETVSKPSQQEFDEGRVTKKVPTAYTQYKTPAQAKEFEVELFENGEKLVLVFEGSDPAVARSIDGKEWNAHIDKGNHFVSNTIGRGTRYLSSVLTSRNPAFVFPNMMRDIPLAILSEYVHGNTKDGITMFKNLALAEGAVRRALRGKPDMNNPMDVKYKQFLENGGATGFVHMKQADQFKKELIRDIKRINNEKNAAVLLSKGFSKGIDYIEQLSEWSENISRFAVYLNHVNKGESPETAANAAKNSTVNFNKKGRLSPILNGTYAFFNAAIQASDKYFKMWGANWKKMAGIHSVLMVQGFLSAMLLDMFGDEDDEGIRQYDKVSDYVKKNYLVIPIPYTDRVATFPMPHVLRAFHGLGVGAYDMMTNRKRPVEVLGDAISGIPQDVLPIDGTGFFDSKGDISPKPFTPTVLRPIVEMTMNENFMGVPIVPEPFTVKQQRLLADTKKARETVSKPAQAFTDALYKLGGGDETGYKMIYKDGELVKVPNIFDVSPQSIEFMFQSYTGGTGTFFANTAKTAGNIMSAGNKLLEGEEFREAVKEVNLNTVPVFRRFVRQAWGDPLKSAYYDAKRDLDTKIEIMRNHKNNNRMEEFAKMQKEIGMDIEKYKIYEKKVDELADLHESLISLEKEEAADAIEKKQRKMMEKVVEIKNK